MGTDTSAVLSALDEAISKITKVSGAGAELDKIYVSPECQRVLENAEKLAKSEGDEYVSVEHITEAILICPRSRYARYSVREEYQNPPSRLSLKSENNARHGR